MQNMLTLMLEFVQICAYHGPWIFGPIDFLKIAKTKKHVPVSIFNDRGIGNRRTTSFNESEASLLVIRQIRLCRRGASVAQGSVDLWSNRFFKNCENEKSRSHFDFQ